MKVLIVDSSTGRGGAREQALRLAAGLKQGQHAEVTLALAEVNHAEVERLPKGVEVVKLARRNRSFLRSFAARREPRAGNHRYLLFFAKLHEVFILELLLVLRAVFVIRRSGCDVVHLNNLLNIQLAIAIAAQICARPCVSVHQDFEYRSHLVKFIAKRMSRHIAISKAIAQDLLSLGIGQEKITIIHNCFDSSRFSVTGAKSNFSELLGLSDEAKVILFAGRLVEWKGADLFIEAMSQVTENVGTVVGVIVGEGSPQYLAELHRIGERLEASSKLFFLPYQNELAPLLRAATLFVHTPKRPEPFGMVVIEAMACGCPVISVREGGPLDIIESGIDGMLVRPRNVSALGAGIHDLVGDKRLRDRIGFAAVKTVQKFNLENCTSQYVSIYKSLVV